MRRLITFCAAAILILAAGSAQADMVVIDFDSDSLSNHELVDDQFLEFGADFNGLARICYSPVGLYPAHSSPNVIENFNLDINRGDIRIDSVGPEWLMAGGYVTGAENVTLTAYDSSDTKLVNLSGLDSTGGANTVGFGTPNIFLNIGASNIDYVIFSIDSGSTFTVDNFTFNPVPVPAAVLLGMLGLGVAGLKLRKFV